MSFKSFSILLIALVCVASAEKGHQSLRHQFFSSTPSLTPSFTPSLGTAMDTLQTCKDVGSTWNSVTGAVDNVKGTWSGSQCDAQCEAQKGIVCGRALKDCCAMECQGTFMYKSCKFDLKLNRKMMGCGV